jgi:hypothetical protein
MNARRRGPRVAIVIFVVLFAGLGGALYAIARQLTTTANPSGAVVFPRQLLGLTKYTGPGAQAAVRANEQRATVQSAGSLSDPVAAFYGDPSGRGNGIWVTVGHASCPVARCVLLPAPQVVQNFRMQGYPDARSFPAGPYGGVLACYTDRIPAGDYVYCVWFDQDYTGVAIFNGVHLSGLGDAAAQTRQIRALVEP